MRQKLFKLILILVPTLVFSQHSEQYLNFSKRLNVVDSSKIEKRFSNGELKYTGTTTYYKYQGKEYTFLTGKHIRYYRNGSRTEGIYDSWGTILENKYFDENGNLISISKTVKLDTDAKNFEEFMNKKKHITFIIETKEFKYSPELSKWYVYETGEYTNSRKSGVWNYYFPNGELKKKIEK